MQALSDRLVAENGVALLVIGVGLLLLTLWAAIFVRGGVMNDPESDDDDSAWIHAGMERTEKVDED